MDETTAAPPTTPADLDIVPEPPKWPTPVGVLSIVFGSLSLVCGGLFGLVGLFGMNTFFQWMASQPGANFDPPPPMPIDPFVVATMLISLIFQVLLIAAGIATVKRNASGRPMHLVYAIGFMITALVGSYAAWEWQAAYASTPEVVQWKAENAGNPSTRGMGQGPSAVQTSVNLGISCAWPIFCLFWFGPKGRSERALRIDEEDRLV